jgi:hypothetical protein
MAHDRVEGDAMLITHELLSVMLGVRRAGVTMALNHLESNDSVVSKRGIIVVRDRKALETLAGRTYGIAEAEQERLTGWKSQKAR